MVKLQIVGHIGVGNGRVAFDQCLQIAAVPLTKALEIVVFILHIQGMLRQLGEVFCVNSILHIERLSEVLTQEMGSAGRESFTVLHHSLYREGVESTGKTLEMRDVWSGETFLVKNGGYNRNVEAYDCRVYRCRVVDA